MTAKLVHDYEKLGAFYLGREYDVESSELQSNLVLYDSKDLVTHAVCVGMTGSGKTGLCIGLLEEAAIDGVPAIAIDPKGDLTNLMLTFDGLEPSEFRPWINEEEATRKGMSGDEYAESQADLWRNGLSDWGQDKTRIKRLKDSADFDIYTPGSSAGTQLSVLQTFSAPEQEILSDTDLLRDQINVTVSSILGLLGLDADPIRSREHILLSTILLKTWQQGRDLGLDEMIRAVQQPPFERVGVFDIDSLFPAKERFEFAMLLNNLIASPTFGSWTGGEPLDIDKLLYTAEGKPRIAIISIAHLSDSERMFFVSLLFSRVLGWMRRQSGTTSLRAILYMDEIFGYLPPVANPPSKAPLLTMLKQARAFGLGLVLATQNPVDLDYKALSNAGTWFLGRLQTERDKARVLDGLEGVGGSAGGKFDRKRFETLLSSLDSRVFLLNNVHEDEPVVFHTRWVLSYLRGPLTRNQIKQLMEHKRVEPDSRSTPSKGNAVLETPSAALPVSQNQRPLVPPAISEYFLPVQSPDIPEENITYVPMLHGSGKVYYSNARIGIATEREFSVLADIPDGPRTVDWDSAIDSELIADDLDSQADDDILTYSEIPAAASKKTSYKTWDKSLKDWVYKSYALELLKSKSLKAVSNPGESERDFRIRLQHVAHEKRDAQIEKLRKKYASKIATMEDRIARADRAVQREQEQAKQQKMQAAVSLGSTLLSALLGRKATSRSTLGRATTTARSASRMMKEKGDIKRAQENVADLKQRLAELEARLRSDVELVAEKFDISSEELETVSLRPKKRDIAVDLFTLVWVPFCKNDSGRFTRAWNPAN